LLENPPSDQIQEIINYRKKVENSFFFKHFIQKTASLVDTTGASKNVLIKLSK
jgi:hypothetical protein